MSKRLLLIVFLGLFTVSYGQISLLKTIDLQYPIARIVHFPQCGDSPIFMCKKSETSYMIVNDGINFEISNNENLLFADHSHIYTSQYSEGDIVIHKFEESGKTYKLIKELKLPRKVGDKQYYLDIEMTDDHLFYFAYQPNTVSKPHKATIDFYNADLNKVFSINEDLSVYNIHCFGIDSVLILKEYVYEKTLTTHLYDHNGKMLKEESFHLAFKPSTQSTVSDFLKNDGIIFTVEQTDTIKTHVIKYDHTGKILWDETLPNHYYGFSEYNEHLITYGGGDFKNPDYKLLFIDEANGKVDTEVELKTHFNDFIKQKNLKPEENSFIPFGFNVNPEHTWLSFVMSIYTTTGKNVDADRILVFHGHQKVQTLDIQLTGNEHPKVVPTDKDHLIVGIGKKVFIYRVQ